MVKASDLQVGGDHYKQFAIQPSEFIYKNKLNWYEANVVKYICRHKSKGGKLDLEKVKHYVDLLIEMEYPTKPAANIATVGTFSIQSVIPEDSPESTWK
jgi:hypothetical protein